MQNPGLQAVDYIEKALAKLARVVDSGIDKVTQTEDLPVTSDFFRMKRIYCRVTLILPLGLPFKTTIFIWRPQFID